MDGEFDRAKFDYPLDGLCLMVDSRAVLCTDFNNQRIRRVDFRSGLVSTYAGGKLGFKHGSCRTAQFQSPQSVCLAPSSVGGPLSGALSGAVDGVYIGDVYSIRYCDGKTVSLVAGSADGGFADGVGGDARFRYVRGLLCTANVQTLYVCDGTNHRLRSVDLKSRTVKTICGDGDWESRDGVGLDAALKVPSGLCFDRSSIVKPESALFITTQDGIRRFDIQTSMCIC